MLLPAAVAIGVVVGARANAALVGRISGIALGGAAIHAGTGRHAILRFHSGL
jgi:hypothetical protein